MTRFVLVGFAACALAISCNTSAAAQTGAGICPRPAAGSVAQDPPDLRSDKGVLEVDLAVRNEQQRDGSTRYCYLLPDGRQSPTLRLKPGDWLVLRLHNELTGPTEGTDAGAPADHRQRGHAHGDHQQSQASGGADPCRRAVMTATSTNLHFHGLSIPAVCHQDDVLKTSIQPSDPPFEYRFRIPGNAPPGLYWYHPHIHGFSSRQVAGGASGALIIEGLERSNREVAGLPERVLVIRDQDLLNPQAAQSAADVAAQAMLDRDGDAANTGTGTGRPAKDLSVNFVPIPYPDYPTATVAMKPDERQLWRVLNASSVTYLNIATLYKRGPRFRANWIGVVAIDGVPLSTSGSVGHATEWRDSIVVSPGGCVEFIVVGPPAGVPAMLVTRTVDTGDGGENDPNRPLVSIVASPDAPEPNSRLAGESQPLPSPALPWLGTVQPDRIRKLYFSEEPGDPARSNGDTRFMLTVEGRKPAPFEPGTSEPDIVVRQGDVEDWIIENRSTELHAFHIHQLHFEVLDWLGLAVNEPFLRDTINIPFFSPRAMQAFPTVRLRMDFRDPGTVGTFVYHCHLLDHEDGGMMGLIRVLPAVTAPSSVSHKR